MGTFGLSMERRTSRQTTRLITQVYAVLFTSFTHCCPFQITEKER
jgi:hypothetical protein